MINPNYLDLETPYPIEWQIEVKNIDENGFFYNITTNSPKKIFAIYFNWLAIINEETLQI